MEITPSQIPSTSTVLSDIKAPAAIQGPTSNFATWAGKLIDLSKMYFWPAGWMPRLRQTYSWQSGLLRFVLRPLANGLWRLVCNDSALRLLRRSAAGRRAAPCMPGTAMA